MKQKQNSKKLRVAYFSIIAIGFLSIAFSSNPPNGRTNAPGEGVCSDCHNQAAPMVDGNLVVDFPTTINADQTYTLTITANNPNALATRAGFQMTILDGSNNLIGSMANPTSSSVVTLSSGREYHEHNPAQAYVGASTTVSWTVDWTAPSGPDMENITYYAASIIANGMDGNSGDLLVLATGSGTLMGGADPLMAAIAQSQDVSCFGGNDGSAEGDATGGTPPYSFSWSNGAMTQNVINFEAGSYTLTVTDMLGATATATVAIDEPDEITVTGVVTNVTCQGADDGSIDGGATGGTPPYSFEWDNGAITNIISNLAPGPYTLTVTDANMCQKSATFTVGPASAIDVNNTTFEDVLCNGDASGSATFEATGGTGNFTYAWSNGFNGPTQSGLEADTYTVVATDENGCTNMGVVTISEPPMLEINEEVVDDAFCFEQATGGIEVSVNGGFGNLDVAWSNGQFGTTIVNLLADTYVATVMDENGCTAIIAVEVGEPDELIIEIDQLIPISCAGANDASLTVLVTGGTPNATPEQYNVNWSNGFEGFSADNLEPGIYDIEVMDVNVCMATLSVEILDPAVLVGAASGMNESSAGANDGSAMINVSGGVGPYTYLWSNGETTSEITELSPGTYTVVATDANGCAVSGSVDVMSAGCVLSGILTVVDVNCFGAFSGEASVEVMNQTDPVMIEWSTGETGTMIGSLPAGPYSAVITDGSNCSFTVSGTIGQPDQLTIQCNTTDETAMGANDGSATCGATGGVAPMSYLWSTGDTTETISGLAPGNYSLVATDANGCTVEGSVMINGFECLIQYELEGTNVNCFGQSNGAAEVMLTGPAQVLWSTGSPLTIINGLTAGQYFITITQSPGCEVTDSITITEPTQIMATVDSTFDASSGMNDGGIYISVTGGVPPYAYSWVLNNTEVWTEEDADSLVAGIYQINIIDANGCVGGQSDIVVSTITGIPNLNGANWAVYPNPVQSKLLIQNNELAITSNVKVISILNMDGSTVYEYQPEITHQTQFEIDLSDLPVGIYNIQILTEEGRIIKRVVKL